MFLSLPGQVENKYQREKRKDEEKSRGRELIGFWVGLPSHHHTVMFIRERKKTWVNSIVRVDRERDGEKEGEGMERGERKTRRRTRREGGLDGGAKRRQRNAIRARNKEVVDDSNLS